ncbi:hypothetical protein [Lysobacter enzymogenes]|uniref:hypothetical protein n=1 Tax=Lysobacter enzymogenes TaxID=69 RepID=UPI0009C74182|nr:hypothetical protein [Lysobacter enzymogenes]UZW61824.1 hypothetical protein BV903_005860 [Lysobacter enzymogenes]
MNVSSNEIAASTPVFVALAMYTLPDRGEYGTQEVVVTPELATAWLRRNEANRKLRHRAVAEYAQAMQRGLWKTTGESIKFSKTGRLLDGQHRLAAIVDSGIALSMVVVTGLDNSAFDAIDTGRSRTGADVLLIEGVGARESATVAAAMPLILNYQRGLVPHNRTRYSNQELIEAWGSQEAIRRSSQFVAKLPRRVMPVMHSKALFLHWAFCQRDVEAADEFLERLYSGELLGKTEPLYHLRQRLLSMRMEGKTISEMVVLHACIKAWNAMRLGKTYTTWRSVFPKSDESFPEIAR